MFVKRSGYHSPTQHPRPNLAPILCVASCSYDLPPDGPDKIWARCRVEKCLELAPLLGEEKPRNVAIKQAQTRVAMISTIGLNQHFLSNSRAG